MKQPKKILKKRVRRVLTSARLFSAMLRGASKRDVRKSCQAVGHDYVNHKCARCGDERRNQ